MKFKLILVLIVFLLTPFILASSTFFDNSDDFFIMDNITIVEVAPVPTPTPPPAPAPSGGGGGRSYECITDAQCDESEFCYENKCYEYECDSDEDCVGDETCWINRCVILFDMKIIEVQSPIFPGEFFNFTYYIKGVAAIHGDVIINFWLEQNGIIVTEGFDTIYMGDFEEKIESTELFLPVSISNGTYNFYAEVEYDSYYARALRVISVEFLTEEIARERGIITGKIIEPIEEERGVFYYLIPIMLGLAVFVLAIIIYWERKKIKNALVYEKKFIRRHKISILVVIFFILIGGAIYYFNRPIMIMFFEDVLSKRFFIWLAVFILIAALIVLTKKRIKRRKSVKPRISGAKKIRKKKTISPIKKAVPRIKKFVSKRRLKKLRRKFVASKKIKKRKKKEVFSDIKEKLKLLKERGYNTTEFDYKLKYQNKNKMENIMNKFKKSKISKKKKGGVKKKF